MSPKKKLSKKYVLDALEQQIEDEIERGEWKPVSPERLAEVIAAIQLPPVIHRGGPRPGAGRKPLPPMTRRVQLTVSVKPETAKRFRSLAKKKKLSLGAVLDRLGA